MKNVIIAILVALLIVAGFMIGAKKKANVVYEPWPETEPANPTTPRPTVTPTQTNPTNNQNQPGWKKSPVFGFYYPEGFSMTEGYGDPSGMGTGTPENGIPESMAFSVANNDLMILWGGNQGSLTNCTANDYDVFSYGVSRYVCLRGRPASIGHVSARAVVTSEELKLFGDFVLKNQ